MIFTNAWLLLVSAWWMCRHPLHHIGMGGGRWIRLMVALVALEAAGIIVFAFSPPLSPVYDPAPSLLDIALIVLWVPLAEELFFRGVFLAHFTRNLGAWMAAGGVSILFASLHAVQDVFVPMFVLSLLASTLTLLSGNVLWAVGLHATWNTLALFGFPAEVRIWASGIGLAALVLVTGVSMARRTASAPPREIVHDAQ